MFTVAPCAYPVRTPRSYAGTVAASELVGDLPPPGQVLLLRLLFVA